MNGTALRDVGHNNTMSTAQTVEQILVDFDRDYWMNAEEAIEYGIVDKVVTKL